MSLEMTMLANIIHEWFGLEPGDDNFMCMAAQLMAIRRGWAEDTLSENPARREGRGE